MSVVISLTDRKMFRRYIHGRRFKAPTFAIRGIQDQPAGTALHTDGGRLHRADVFISFEISYALIEWASTGLVQLLNF